MLSALLGGQSREHLFERGPVNARAERGRNLSSRQRAIVKSCFLDLASEEAVARTRVAQAKQEMPFAGRVSAQAALPAIGDIGPPIQNAVAINGDTIVGSRDDGDVDE